MKKSIEKKPFRIHWTLLICTSFLIVGIQDAFARAAVPLEFSRTVSGARIIADTTARPGGPAVEVRGGRDAEDLAPTPPMGWNSWNWFGKDQINEKVVREVIDAVVKEGLRDAGYKYIIVDGGWRDTVLGKNGELLANPVRFPHGIKALADYAHANGLKFGLHTVPGTMDCGGDPVGGYGHEKVQIQQFVDWGVDFIKLDKCKMRGGWNEELLKTTYQKWHDLLKDCGRKIVLSISAYRFRDWNPEIGQMSRTTGDIGARVNGGARFDTFETKRPSSVMKLADINSQSAAAARPGYWNDPDMLVVGSQGLTVDEQKIHFALWCIMSSPLFLGNDPRHMGTDEKAIILNRDCIRVDQDPTGQGKRVEQNGNSEVWAKKLKNGDMAVLLINRSPVETADISIDFQMLGISGPLTISDIYGKKTLGTYTNQFSYRIAPQSGLFLLCKKHDGVSK